MENDEDVEHVYAQAQRAAEAIAARHAEPPQVALVLGTGLGHLADQIADATSLPYTDLPGFARATVSGHAGRLVLGRLGGVAVAAMQGRFHLYEGYTPQQVVFPLRVLRLLGARTLVVTNAAGGLTSALTAGSLLLLNDHIGLPTLAGRNPLIGANDERFGPRFPAMTAAYDPALRSLARQVAQALGQQLFEGVYAMVSGPNYESPAELRLLRLLGADAVGMSTVPEVIAARHMGMRVLAISCITNAALSDDTTAHEPSHAEVETVAREAGGRLGQLIAGVIERLVSLDVE